MSYEKLLRGSDSHTARWAISEIDTLRADLAAAEEKVHKADGMAGEINMLNKAYRDSMSDLVAAQDRYEAIQRDLNAVLKDRARFSDKPDWIGSLLGCHIENLEHRASIAEEAYRWKRDALATVQARYEWLLRKDTDLYPNYIKRGEWAACVNEGQWRLITAKASTPEEAIDKAIAEEVEGE